VPWRDGRAVQHRGILLLAHSVLSHRSGCNHDDADLGPPKQTRDVMNIINEEQRRQPYAIGRALRAIVDRNQTELNHVGLLHDSLVLA
jgi:hypothetical protein